MTLHTFSGVHIGEDCSGLTGTHNNELFFECDFNNLRGLTLQRCELNRSKFSTDKIADALGFTLTLACPSFRGVEYSPLLFDLFLLLATMTRGNDEKRERLKDVIGRERAKELLAAMKGIE